MKGVTERVDLNRPLRSCLRRTVKVRLESVLRPVIRLSSYPSYPKRCLQAVRCFKVRSSAYTPNLLSGNGLLGRSGDRSSPYRCLMITIVNSDLTGWMWSAAGSVHIKISVHDTIPKMYKAEQRCSSHHRLPVYIVDFVRILKL